MRAKGRANYNPLRGSDNPDAKLTERQARAIRAACARGVHQRDLARRYGVSQATISGIHTRTKWTHA